MRKLSKKITSGFLAGAMAFSMMTIPTVSVQAATEHWNDASTELASWSDWKEQWSTFSTNYEKVSMTPGTNESELNFAWYSQTEETPRVRFATSEDMQTSQQEFSGTQTAITAELIGESSYTANGLAGYFANKVTVTGLAENTQYYYQVYQNQSWGEVKPYATKSFSQYSFLYVGDPQIGACKNQTSAEGAQMADNAAGTTTL